jgi:DHA2 family multidrug resistance protein
VTWVLTSYIVASAIALPITGWLAERIGRKELLVGSMAAFVLSSMACGLSVNLTEMVIFRVLQGISGAFMLPVGQAVMLDATRPSSHAKMMGLWGAGVTIGPILGPILGGWLTSNYYWRWCFFINVPLGAAALFLIVTNLPRTPRRKMDFDLTGFLLLGIAIGALQLLLDRGEQIDWFDSGEAWIYATLTIALGWAALYHLSTARNPLFPRGMFADRNLVVANLTMVTMTVTVYSVMALLAPLLQTLLGYSVLGAGVAMATRGIGVVITMQVSQILMRRGFNPRLIVASGLLLTAYSMMRMSGWSLAVDRFEIMLVGLIQGLGLGLIFIPLNILAFSTLKPEFRTDASSMLNLTRSIGGSIGIAVTTVIMSRHMQVNHAELAERLTADTLGPVNPAMASRLGDVGEAALRVVDGEVMRQAAMIAYINNFYLIGLLCLVSLPVVFLIKKPQRPPG